MTWLQRLLHREEMEAHLDKELRFHLEQHAADLVSRGVEPREARRQARLALGGPEQVKEGCRDARGTRWLEDFWQDVRYALRTLRQKPAFAATAILTLALGSGATTVMFTVINGVLLQPLPYPEPDRLVTLQERTDWRTRLGDRWAFSYPNLLDCRRESRALAPLAAWRFSGGTLSGTSAAEYVESRQISAELFTVLGVPLAQGRAFLPEEDKPGAAPVAILGYGLWQRRFGGSRAAVGSSVVFDGKSYTVVGVAPPGFQLSGEADILTPIGQNTEPVMQRRDAHPGIRVFARLHHGISLAQAQAELALIGRNLAAQFPKSNAGRTFLAETLRPEVAGDVRATLWLLLGAVGLVLLIACVNVASLLLARAVSRERELAMRVALGAGRGRLIRQCLTESAVLGISGGLLGLLLAAEGVRPFVAFWPSGLPRAEEVHVDSRVLLFTLAVSLCCGLLFGLAPALRTPVRRLEEALRNGSRAVAGSSRRIHAGFVAVEIALAIVLLVAAGMLGNTVLRLSALDPGVDVRNVLVARMALSPATLNDPGRIRAAWEDVLEHARQTPGVQSVSMVDTVPMREGNNQLGYWTTPAEPPADQQPVALATCVTPDYLAVMGVKLRKGRFFSNQDRLESEPVIVIDEQFAQHAFNQEEPIGKRVWVQSMGSARVIGVVGHVRHWGLALDDQAQVRDQFYYPFAQVPDKLLRRWSELMSLAIRTNIPPLHEVEALRHQVRGVLGDQALYEIRTMEQLASLTLSQQRFLLLLFGIFAAFALLLASVGIYGVLAYLTGQRVPEIGVRMALGASGPDVIRLVLKESFRIVLLGATVGLASAVGAGRVLSRLVPGVQPTEPVTFFLMSAVLFAAALVATLPPARRASRIDPSVALRQA